MWEAAARYTGLDWEKPAYSWVLRGHGALALILTGGVAHGILSHQGDDTPLGARVLPESPQVLATLYQDPMDQFGPAVQSPSLPFGSGLYNKSPHNRSVSSSASFQTLPAQEGRPLCTWQHLPHTSPAPLLHTQNHPCSG